MRLFIMDSITPPGHRAATGTFTLAGIRQTTSHVIPVPIMTPVPCLASPRQPSGPQQLQWPSNSVWFGQIPSYAKPVPSYLTRVPGFASLPQQRPSNSVSFGQIQARKP
eukprot:scpid62635/ scgid19666/ 